MSNSTERKAKTAARSAVAASSPTPGPWRVMRDTGLRQRIQTSGDKGTLAYMTARPFAWGANFSHAQISANANLIAAAPELLVACELAEIMLRDGGTFPIRGQTWLVLSAAIKKAKGASELQSAAASNKEPTE